MSLSCFIGKGRPFHRTGAVTANAIASHNAWHFHELTLRCPRIIFPFFSRRERRTPVSKLAFFVCDWLHAEVTKSSAAMNLSMTERSWTENKYAFAAPLHQCRVNLRNIACEANLVRFDLLLLGEMPAHSHRNQAFPRFRPSSLLDSFSMGVQVIVKICNVNIPRSKLRFMKNDECTMIIIFCTIQLTEPTVYLTQTALSSCHMTMVRSKLFQKYSPCTIIVISCLL